MTKFEAKLAAYAKKKITGHIPAALADSKAIERRNKAHYGPHGPDRNRPTFHKHGTPES